MKRKKTHYFTACTSDSIYGKGTIQPNSTLLYESVYVHTWAIQEELGD